MTTTGNMGLDALADAIAERVWQRMKTEQNPYISTKEVASRLGRTPRAVQRMANSGAIPCFRDGKLMMFRWAEVEAAVQAWGSNEQAR